MPKSKSVKFSTPDGPRYASLVAGARVVGDVPLTKEGTDAVGELIAAATRRFGQTIAKTDGIPTEKNDSD